MYRLIIITGLLSYPFLTHLLILVNAEQYALVALMGISIMALVSGWYRRKQFSLAGTEIYFLVLVLGAINLATHSAQALSAPFIAVNFMLAVFVLGSLKKHNGAVFERLLACVHGESVQPVAHRLARMFTAIWGWYFAAMTLISLLLALFAPLRWWSWFSNVGYFVLTPALILVMHAYQTRMFEKYGVPIRFRDIARVLKMPLTDVRHPFYGFRRRRV